MPNQFNLADLMDSRYGAGAWTHWNGTAGSGTDVVPALADGSALIRANGGYGEILVPPGRFAWKSVVGTDMLCGITIRGIGPESGPGFVCQLTGAVMFRYPASAFTGGGVENCSIFMDKGKGMSGVTCIHLQGNTTLQPSEMEFRNLNVTAYQDTDGWLAHFYANGMNRTSPQGIRGLNLHDLKFFRGYGTFGCAFYGVVNLRIDTLGLYSPIVGGPLTALDLIFGGSADPDTHTTQGDAHMIVNLNEIKISHTSHFAFYGYNEATKIGVNNTASYIRGEIRANSLVGTLGAGSNLSIY